MGIFRQILPMSPTTVHAGAFCSLWSYDFSSGSSTQVEGTNFTTRLFFHGDSIRYQCRDGRFLNVFVTSVGGNRICGVKSHEEVPRALRLPGRPRVRNAISPPYLYVSSKDACFVLHKKGGRLVYLRVRIC